MRISDWSSDVCSSDLQPTLDRHGRIAVALQLGTAALVAAQTQEPHPPRAADGRRQEAAKQPHGEHAGLYDDRIYPPRRGARLRERTRRHRLGAWTRVGWGKGVEVRVEIGGRLVLKKKIEAEIIM